jgi:UDP-N-acetylmuramate dehydrogenase
MIVQHHVPLLAFNTFRIAATADALVHIADESDIHALLADPKWAAADKLVLGGGSNIVLTGNVKLLVLKVDIMGKKRVNETAKAFVVEAGAGENWHDFVIWTLAQNMPGLENLAMIPGTVGASPVQNIGAYGVELQDRFDSLDAIDLQTGHVFTLNAAECAFAYRDSIFKHAPTGLKDKAMILRVRFALPKSWTPSLGYADLEKKMAEQNCPQPDAQQVLRWVCDLRRAKLPDPSVVGNVGSFFKNPTVTPQQFTNIIAHHPKMVYYRLTNGDIKLAAGWLIEACGLRGKTVGQVGVYEKQALVLVNQGGAATGAEVMTLAKTIQHRVHERFGIRIEIEPVVI